MTKLTAFFDLIKNQFEYGGKKYAHDKEKESTDCLFDDFGKGWLFGTMAKYCKRIKNLKRERDILKISTYIYILWLKRGFHISTLGSSTPVNTTVDIKSKYFNTFRVLTTEFLHHNPPIYNIDINTVIDNLYGVFTDWNNKDWGNLKEKDLMGAFGLCYGIWVSEFSESAGRDQDCYNETKGKPE